MENKRNIHHDFQHFLDFKDQHIISLFSELRDYIIALYPEGNELLYHTHALTTVFSISDKLSDAYCLIPIYTNHFNLGFSKGTLLDDPHKLLQGTGKLMRHIPIESSGDFRNKKVEKLIRNAIEFAIEDADKKSTVSGKMISKIKI